MSSMHQIAIFASGTGSNAQAIIDYFADRQDVKVALVASNNSNAKVLEKARNANIDTLHLSPELRKDTHSLIAELKNKGIALIALAGYMKLIPAALIKAFPNRILNIHPALLPKFGGRGMYGMKVHEAVKSAGETESGITIHLVNEAYDEGEVLFQKAIPIDPADPVDVIRDKVLKLEHTFYPQIIDRVLTGVKKES